MVLGAGGMVGHVVALHLRECGFEVTTQSANTPLDQETVLVDARDTVALDKVLLSRKFDAVVNCIGLLIAESEHRQHDAVLLNAYLPHYLESKFRDTTTKVITVGTNSPHLPGGRQASSGGSFYAQTKALGEISNAKDLTFRTSVIGPDISKDGKGLVNWFFHQKGEVLGYANTLWNGVTSIRLAMAIPAAINQGITGIYSLVPDASISKLHLLQLIQKEFDFKGAQIKESVGPDNGTVLINTRNDFDFPIPDYRQQIKEMRVWVDDHAYLYPHYDFLGHAK